jgi:26S proteasome regulatory subunit T1
MFRPDEDDVPRALDDTELAILSSYSRGPFSKEIREVDKEISELRTHIDKSQAGRENAFGLVSSSTWDKKQAASSVVFLFEYVGHVTKILPPPTKPEERQHYIISFRHSSKYVVEGGKELDPSDITEGCRVACQQRDLTIEHALPPSVDPLVATMEIQDKPDVTYADVGGCKEQLQLLSEIIEMPLLHPERFENLGIKPPKGVLFFGPPGTGKTLLARAVANKTDSSFIRVIGSELVKKYVGEGARMVREIFKIAKSKRSCIIFFDEIDAFGTSRGGGSSDSAGSEVQRTMLELISQLDGFDNRGTVKVLMATNRPDTLDPALTRPGRLDRKIEFSLPDLDGRVAIFKIHTKTMNVDRGVRFEILARLCPNATGADLKSVCTEAGIIAVRARKKSISEKDFLAAVNKVIKGYSKFSATPSYMSYN